MLLGHTPTHYFHKKILGKEPEKNTEFLDKVMYCVGIFGPIFTLDQVFRVWVLHNVEGISVVAWGSYFVFSILWTTYGFVHKEKVIIISSIITGILNGLIFFGVLMYTI